VSIKLNSGALADQLSQPILDRIWNQAWSKYSANNYLVETASYIVFTDGTNYYVKNGATGIIEYSDTSASNTIQYAINGAYNKGGGRVFVINVSEPSNVTYKPGVSVWYNIPHLYVKDVPTLELVSEINTGVQSSSADNGRNVVVENNILYGISNSGNKFVVYDVSNLSNPVFMSSLSATGINIAKIGDYIVYSMVTGLTVLDVTDPSMPRYVTTLNLGDWVHGIRVYGNYILACMHVANKLVIVDISDIRNPTVTSTLSGQINFHGAHDVVMEGRWVFVANHLAGSGEYGLTVVSAPNPYSPWVAYGYQPNTQFSYVEKHGGYLFVGSHTPTKGLWIYNVRDPSKISLIKTILTNEDSIGYWMDFYGDWLVVMSPNAKNIHLLNLQTLNVDYTLNVSDAYQLRHIYVYKDLLFVSLNKFDGTNYNWYIKIYRFRHDNMPYSIAKNIARKIEWTLYSAKYYVKKTNSGVATITSGSTSVTVNHGLATAPSKVLLTPLSQPSGKLWVQNITSTSFDITTDTAPSSDLSVSWRAEV
jgi:hypothetical protein